MQELRSSKGRAYLVEVVCGQTMLAGPASYIADIDLRSAGGSPTMKTAQTIPEKQRRHQ